MIYAVVIYGYLLFRIVVKIAKMDEKEKHMAADIQELKKSLVEQRAAFEALRARAQKQFDAATAEIARLKELCDVDPAEFDGLDAAIDSLTKDMNGIIPDSPTEPTPEGQ